MPRQDPMSFYLLPQRFLDACQKLCWHEQLTLKSGRSMYDGNEMPEDPAAERQPESTAMSRSLKETLRP